MLAFSKYLEMRKMKRPRMINSLHKERIRILFWSHRMRNTAMAIDPNKFQSIYSTTLKG